MNEIASSLVSLTPRNDGILDGILNEIASVALLPRNDGILEFSVMISRDKAEGWQTLRHCPAWPDNLYKKLYFYFFGLKKAKQF